MSRRATWEAAAAALASLALACVTNPATGRREFSLVSEGQEISNTDNPFKLSVKWLVEGAIGSTGLQ